MKKNQRDLSSPATLKPRSDRFERQLTPAQVQEIVGWFATKSYTEILGELKTRYCIKIGIGTLHRFKQRNENPQEILSSLKKVQAEIASIKDRVDSLVAGLNARRLN